MDAQPIWKKICMYDPKTSPSLPSCPKTMRRIVIVGTSGSGKTTLARQLGAHLNIPVVELDALHWGANWTPIPLSTLREQVEAALCGEAWIVDGNYSKVRDLTWGRADTVIWLDYHLQVVMRRVFWRTLTRALSREELWHGNRERLGTALFSKESILLWAWQTHRKNRQTYTKLTSQPEYAHLQIVRHRSPQQTQLWLAHINNKQR